MRGFLNRRLGNFFIATRYYAEEGGFAPRNVGLARAVVVGNVGQDARIVKHDEENSTAYFSVATTRVGREQGTLVSKTDWYQVTARSKPLVEMIEKNVKKGALVYVEGPMDYRSSQDASGTERTSVYIRLQSNANLRILKWPVTDGERPEKGGKDGVFGSEGQVYD